MRSLLVFSILGFACAAPAQTINSWIKPGSGDWQDATAWSLGVPTPDQTVMLTNQGWKAVAIGLATGSRDVASVILGGYTDSFNVLLLNYAGFEVPLTTGTINVGTNSAITALASMLNVSTNVGTGALTNEYFFNQGESAIVTADSVQIGTMQAAGTYNLTNGSLNAQQVVVGMMNLVPPYYFNPSPFNSNTVFNQFGGSVAASFLRLDGGTYNFSDGSVSGAVQVRAGAFRQTGGSVTGSVGVNNGTYLLSSGIVRQQTLTLPAVALFSGPNIDATFSQTGGTNYCDAIEVWFFFGNPAAIVNGPGRYVLSNGVLCVSNVTRLNPGGDFQQWGGLQTNAGTAVIGEMAPPFHSSHNAAFKLGGGTLLTPYIDIDYGSVEQSGGTNLVATHVAVGVPGRLASYTLSAGSLCDSTASVTTTDNGYPSELHALFTQSGGIHIVTNLLSLSGGGEVQYAGTSGYFLRGGQLTAGTLELTGAATFDHSGGTLGLGGLLTLGSGVWNEETTGQQFGQLLLSSSTNSTNSTLKLPPGPCQLRFANSSSLGWSSDARLWIVGWNGSPNGGGQHQVVFGSNASSLTAQQLSQIQFRDPAGNSGLSPAAILATGELVPARMLASQKTANGLTLQWTTGTLQSATNVIGPYEDVPGASSPYSVQFNGPSRFFRLRF